MPNVNERNALSLNEEQKRLTSLVERQRKEIDQLKLDLLNLRQELTAIKTIAVSRIGTGATG
jgi:hypothetical protein